MSRHLEVAQITNLYGPTEATIDAVGFAVEGDDPMRASRLGVRSGTRGFMYWMVVWSLFLLGLLGSFTLRGLGLVAGMLGAAG